VAPSALAAPTPDSWPMYNGDYSGRRFSELTTLDSRTVASLTLG
jgi:alcohol dehydrogenase (cytochrome c)